MILPAEGNALEEQAKNKDDDDDKEKAVKVEANEDGDEAKYKCTISSERLAYLKRLVNEAVRDHRVFTIKGGWQTLRRAFLKRNWIEKYDQPKTQKPLLCGSSSSEDVCSNLPPRQAWETPSAHVAKCERTVMSRLLQMHDVDFYWNSRKDQHDMQMRLNCHKLLNRFNRSLFTSKEGLCLLLQQMYWHNEPGLANVNFPRCYVLGFPDHYNNFLDDFRLTACMSLVRFVLDQYAKEEKYGVQSPEGSVPYTAYHFAMDRLNEFIASKKHLDIDITIPKVEDVDWNAFLEHFRMVVHDGRLFLESKDHSIYTLVGLGKSLMKNLQPYWPQFELDGMRNIWIMKPGNKCRGRGIQLIKDVGVVAKVVELKLKYVVQKYIEQPLIIYSTKFDIRQWFMITSVQPLQIWMYRDSYLRFSSQNFSLSNFHESLHLTNYAVQCKYKHTNDRNKALPDENMWDCHMFKEYLMRIGREEAWDLIVYPGMKESIIGAMLACQDTMDRRPNTFELYGADFILAEDFKPWLLEINSSPDLSSSTSVTARMCPQCLEDLVKVVIDRRKDPNCGTGLFELIYKQSLPRAPAYLGMSLSVRGRRIFRKNKTKKEKESVGRRTSVKLATPDAERPPPPAVVVPKRYSGPVIADLMEDLKKSLHHETTAADWDAGVEHAFPIRTSKKPSKNEQRHKTKRKRKLPEEQAAAATASASKESKK